MPRSIWTWSQVSRINVTISTAVFRPCGGEARRRIIYTPSGFHGQEAPSLPTYGSSSRMSDLSASLPRSRVFSSETRGEKWAMAPATGPERPRFWPWPVSSSRGLTDPIMASAYERSLSASGGALAHYWYPCTLSRSSDSGKDQSMHRKTRHNIAQNAATVRVVRSALSQADPSYPLQLLMQDSGDIQSQSSSESKCPLVRSRTPALSHRRLLCRR